MMLTALSTRLLAAQPFNPGGFKRWSKHSLAHWLSQPAVDRMVSAVIDDTPVALLNHSARRDESA